MRKFFKTFLTALRALRRNLMRAALTTLGIVIGVGAVIAMMEIGSGSSKAIQGTIANMGANNIMVWPGSASPRGVSTGSGGRVNLTAEDAEALARECTALRGVAPIVDTRTQVVYGRSNTAVEIIGTTPTFLTVRDWKVIEGESISDLDVRNGSKVCLLGRSVIAALFPPGHSPVGEDVRINNVTFKVIGVLGSKGANMMGRDQDEIVIAPWTSVKSRVSGSPMAQANQSGGGGGSGGGGSGGSSSSAANSTSTLYPARPVQLYPEQSAVQAANSPTAVVRFAHIDNIVAAANSTREIDLAVKQITDVLRERHRLEPDEPDDFNVRSLTEFTNALTGTQRVMTNLLLCVALISLVVGGVGIMNIMLVSVTERTREIGLRMAVGARGGDILQQFLTEAVVLSLLGGVIGILLGTGASFLVQQLLGWPTASSPGAIVAAVAVSATVGIVFGYYPAWKASRLDPIEALRYE